jgi:hypothetical protein
VGLEVYRRNGQRVNVLEPAPNFNAKLLSQFSKHPFTASGAFVSVPAQISRHRNGTGLIEVL